MSKFEHKKVMPRYSAIAIIMTLIATAIVGKALYIMTAKHDYWMQVAERQKRDSVTVKPNRGNILSCAGQLMASSLPEFKVFMDFKALTEAGFHLPGTPQDIPGENSRGIQAPSHRGTRQEEPPLGGIWKSYRL